MACACGKNRTAQRAAQQGLQFVYDYTPPESETVTTFGTPLEAKRELRKRGGGTIRRRTVSTQPAA